MSLYTEKRSAQFKGPITSDDYNKRIESVFKDLSLMYNKTGLTEENVIRAYQRLLKQFFSLGEALADLQARIDALETDDATITFTNPTHDDNDRFTGIYVGDPTYKIAEVDKCTQDLQHGVLILPKVSASSLSKLDLLDNNGNTILPSTLESRILPDTTSADSLAATIDTSPVENAFLNQVGSIWERNVIVSNSNTNGARLNLYVRIPDEFSTTKDSNVIVIHPYPIMGCDIMSVGYSTKTDILLNDNDVYTPINNTAIHDGNPEAVGWIAPGGWDGDAIINAGPKVFYFDPKQVTAIKIDLRQKNYYTDSGRFVYSYGLSGLDVRNDKFTNQGKFIVKFEAQAGKSITALNSVEPHIWNVAEAEIPDVFSYRLIWETSLNSGVYVGTPVIPSKRVWIEITLKPTSGGGTPALSALVLDGSFS